MKYILTIIIALLLSGSAGAQYESTDNYVKHIRIKRNSSIEEMAEKITAWSETPKEQLRAIFSWIAYHIEYDTRALRLGKSSDAAPLEVVQKGRAVCHGYSNLFAALSKAVNIDAYVISGFSKGYGFEDRKKLEKADHAWNAVLLNNQWKLVDATWGAGYLNNRGRYVSRMQEKYFLADPYFFVTEHLPEDPAWQLLPCPVKPDEYLKDSSKILKIARNKDKCYDYKDTLKQYTQLDSIQQRIATARRMINYFPDNVYSPATLLNQAAYYYSKPLMESNLPTKEKLPLAKKSLKYYKKARSLLKRVRGDQERQLRKMIDKNIENVEKFLDFYEK